MAGGLKSRTCSPVSYYLPAFHDKTGLHMEWSAEMSGHKKAPINRGFFYEAQVEDLIIPAKRTEYLQQAQEHIV